MTEGNTMVDIHSHILPGIDDGALSVEESIEIIRISADSGVDTIVATPHLMPGRYMVRAKERDKLISELQEQIIQHRIDIQILPGRECHLSPEIFESEEDLKKITVNDAGRYVLVEPPFLEFPDYVDQMIFEFQVRGIIPVLAHIERYVDVIRNPNFTLEYIQKGCLTQVNVGSVVGKYGPDVQKTSHILLHHGMAHIIASDIHSPRSMPLGDGFSIVAEMVGREEAINLFDIRPRAMVNGKIVPILQPLEYHRKRSIWNLWGLLNSPMSHWRINS